MVPPAYHHPVGDETSSSGDKSGWEAKSDGEKAKIVLGVIATIVSILVGLNTLTGFNPVSLVSDSSPSPSAIPSAAATTDTPYQPPYDPPVTEPPGQDESDPPEDEPSSDSPSPSPTEDTALFSMESKEWVGPCNPSCSMTAMFRNLGGEDGTATATFYVMPAGDTQHYLAYCSVVIPGAAHNDVSRADCVAYSATLQAYFNAHPSGRVFMNVTVHNPT